MFQKIETLFYYKYYYTYFNGYNMNYLDYIIESAVEKPKFNDNFWKWFGNSKIVDNNGNPLVCYHCTNSTFDIFDKNKIGTAHDKGYYGTGFYFSLFKNKYYGKKCLKCYLNIKNPYFVQYMNNDTIEEFSKLNLIPNNLKSIIEKIRLLKNDFQQNAKINSKNIETKYGKNKIYTVTYKNNQFTTDEAMNNLNTDIAEIKHMAWINFYGDTENKIIKELLSNSNSEQYSNAIKKAGYDGIIVVSSSSNNVKNAMELIAFEPNQIKSINNNGEWNPNSNNINENNEYVVFNSNDIKILNKKDSKINENIENNSFKSWFNNSKVIDKNGNPLIVYHGTDSKFDNFKSEYINTRNHKEQFFGFWFTSNKSDAEQYGKNIIKCYLSIQKPATETNIVKYARAFNKKYKLGYESYECGLNLLETKHGRLFQNYLIKNGFDGIIFDNNYIVFEPNQIKIIETNNKITESKIQDKYKDQVQINGEWYHKRIIDNHFGEGFFNKIKIGDEIDWDNNEDNNKIKQQIDGNQLFSIAKNYFGLTNSIHNAGYILPDGSLLKFGENQKDYEHIEIETAFQEYDIDVSMYDFIDKGAIRIIPSSNSITLLISAEPTYQQRKIIIDLLNQGFKINIEYAKNAKDYLLGNKENLQYRSYNLDNSKKLEQDINSFFNNGKLSNEFFENFIIYKK